MGSNASGFYHHQNVHQSHKSSNSGSLLITVQNQSKFATVFSYDDAATVLNQGRCGFPISDFARASWVDYLLIAHNQRNNPDADRNLTHGEAFLLVKVNKPNGVTRHKFTKKDKHGNDKTIERKAFHFQEYAHISIKNAWRTLTGGIQSITYYDSEQFGAQVAFDKLGLDFDGLVWQTLSKTELANDGTDQQNKTTEPTSKYLPVPVAVAKAKELIARHTGVPASAIHIGFDDF